MTRGLFGVLLVAAHAALATSPRADATPTVTHGVMAAEVSDSSVIIWSRTDRPATMHARLNPATAAGTRRVAVSAADDFAGQIRFKGLRAATSYDYEVWFSAADNVEPGQSVHGRFATAPKKRARRAFRVAWTGDFAGQNVCRDATEGFPVFDAIAAERADAFIGLGDMIYADHVCAAVGRYGNDQVAGDFAPATDLAGFHAHWRYNREDEGFQRLLASAPYYGVWDDHEIINDFGPLTDTGRVPPYTPGVKLMPIGLQAYLDYTPTKRYRKQPNRLYRRVRWGRHAEIFLLDNRQYRDANRDADAPDANKTMLGSEQLEWLIDGLQSSSATWKIIASSVPISVPTGWPAEMGRDGWANFDRGSQPTVDGIPQSDTGFERELKLVMAALQETQANAIFITTDVHFAEVFRYEPAAGDAGFSIHEVVVGPGNAGIFPNREFDTTFATQSLFFHGPESAEAVTSWQEAKKWFNYGVIQIDKHGELSAQVKDTHGKTLFEYVIAP